jgi:phosphoglycerol transferase MdoB-like AlkP superfamily enzyme
MNLSNNELKTIRKSRMKDAIIVSQAALMLYFVAAGVMSVRDAVITALVFLVPNCIVGALPAPVRHKARVAPQLICVSTAAYICAGIMAQGTFTWLSETRLALHFYGILLVFALFALIYALSGSVKISVSVGGVIMLVFSIANNVMVEFRGRMFLWSDLQNLETALSVAGSYSYDVTVVCAAAGILLLCSVLAAFCFDCEKIRIPALRIGLRTVAGAAAIWVLVAFFTGYLMHGTGILITWDDNDYEESPVLYFCEMLRRSTVEPPEGYSEESLARITESVENDTEASESKPHIVVIMSEAFSDLTRIGDFDTNKPVLPFTTAIMQQSIRGYVYSSSFGGNTANSEFEFLTGCTMSFIPSGSTPYQVYIKYEKDSLVSILKEQGYTAEAYHPYGSAGYNREEVYSLLGFDKSVFIDDFTNKRFLRNYVTDESDYDNLIARFVQRGEDEQLFLLNITMQNHGSYKNEKYESTVSIVDHEGEFPQAEQYLSLLRESDNALRRLIDYFRAQDDEIIVLFFGDHQPSLEPEFYQMLYGKDLDTLTDEEEMRKYLTPFFIWSNKGLDAEDVGDTSINYLSGLLLDAAGLESSDFIEYLRGLYGEYPVISAQGCYDAEGNYVPTGEAELDDYQILQYNYLFDTGKYLKNFFGLKEATE